MNMEINGLEGVIRFGANPGPYQYHAALGTDQGACLSLGERGTGPRLVYRVQAQEVILYERDPEKRQTYAKVWCEFEITQLNNPVFPKHPLGGKWLLLSCDAAVRLSEAQMDEVWALFRYYFFGDPEWPYHDEPSVSLEETIARIPGLKEDLEAIKKILSEPE